MAKRVKILIGTVVTPYQAMKFDRAWKQRDDCMNRSQFIKMAINAYAGEDIFEVK